MNREYESMTRVKIFGVTIRVWSTRKELCFAPDYSLLANLKEVEKKYTFHEQAVEIAKVIEAFSDIAAYEILDDLGNGGIIYPDWK